jgi:hypothetical protein
MYVVGGVGERPVFDKATEERIRKIIRKGTRLFRIIATIALLVATIRLVLQLVLV